MRFLKYIFLFTILAGPCLLIAQESNTEGGKTTGTSNTDNSTDGLTQAGDAGDGTQIFYEGKVKIIVRTVNGVTTVTYDSSAINGTDPANDQKYLEDVKDVYQTIKKIEEQKKDPTHLNNVGGKGTWKLVVEGPIIGVKQEQNGRDGGGGYAMSPMGRLVIVDQAVQANTNDNPDNTNELSTPALSEMVNVYPNPAKSFVQVDLKGDASAQVRVLDISGKEVYAAPGMQQYQTRIDISDFNKGFYFIEVQANGERAIKKFAKL